MNNQKYEELQKQAWEMSKGVDAIDYLCDYIEKNPNLPEAYLVRGEILGYFELFEKAIIDFEKVIEIDPNIPQTYYGRGTVYAKSGNDYNKALDDFNKAIALDINYAAAYVNRGNIYLKLGKFQEAINDCNKAIELETDNSKEAFLPYYNRGLAYMNLGEPEKAFDDYNKVITLAPENTPENTEAYAKRGLLYSQLGKPQEAIRDYEKFLELDRQRMAAGESLSNNDYEKFLELDPDNKIAKLVRDELARLKRGRPAKGNKVPINKEQITLIICSVIGFVIGTIIGSGKGNVILGMWFGIGGGVALGFLPAIPGIFKIAYREDGGFFEALKSTLLGGGIWLVIFMVAGPIGFIIRFIKSK